MKINTGDNKLIGTWKTDNGLIILIINNNNTFLWKELGNDEKIIAEYSGPLTVDSSKIYLSTQDGESEFIYSLSNKKINYRG